MARPIAFAAAPFAFALALGSAVSAAAGGARFGTIRWRGLVDDEVVLEVSGDEVARQGGADAGDRVEVRAPMPAEDVVAYVRTLHGRALASLDEGPSEDNDWTATVIVSNERRSPEEVELELVWIQVPEGERARNDRADDGARERPSAGPVPRPMPPPPPVERQPLREVLGEDLSRSGRPIDRMRWRGRVDGSDHIDIRGEKVSVRHQKALPIQEMDYRFTAPLPSQEVDLELLKIEGRGEIRLREQPSASNDWTATVSVDDPSGGAADYEFELRWERPRSVRVGASGTPMDTLVWSGYVDGRDVLVVHGKEVRIENQAGKGVRLDSSHFTAPLPSRPAIVSLSKLEGRGEVRIEQQPEAGNRWTLRVRIDDEKGGEGYYKIELSWPRN